MTSQQKVSRRTIAKGAAWSVPVVAVAAAAPAASASTTTPVDLQLDGSCGAAGLLNVGFVLTAGTEPVPAGTVITATGNGLLGAGVFTLSQQLANVALISGGQTVTLTADLAPGATLSMTTAITVNVAWSVTATAALPTGYTLGSAAKPQGTVQSTLVFCDAS